MARAKLGEILVAAGVIDRSQLGAALAEQKEVDRPLGMTLVRMGYLDEPTLIRTLAQQLQLPMAHLQGKRIPQEVLEWISLDLADAHRCLPLFVRGEGGERTLFVAMEDPSRAEVIEELSRHAGMPIQPVLVAPSEVEEALHRHHDLMVTGAPSSPPLCAPGSGGDAPAGDAMAAPVPPLDPLPRGPGLEASLDSDDDSLGEASSELLRLDLPSEVPASPRAEPVSQVAILRALTQLLIQKGVFTRDELIERVHAFASRDGSDGGA